MLKIKWHYEDRLKICATANGCQITKEMYGDIDDAISNAVVMYDTFAKCGVKYVDIISVSTGEKVVTISDDENPDNDFGLSDEDKLELELVSQFDD